MCWERENVIGMGRIIVEKSLHCLAESTPWLQDPPAKGVLTSNNGKDMKVLRKARSLLLANGQNFG